ncbi:hypothetical protein BDF14DRAFT_1853093 [Spinellus fusiger]|nr:hypothetical protein BDF14DRAFT_1853093 [Spinellus fusiger]
MQPIVLYNFTLLDRRNELWSLNPFKIHYACVLKNIPFTNKWLEFHEIPEVIPGITKTNTPPTVPVIVDANDTVVQDSWKIIKYLDVTYPDSLSLFNGGESLHYFFYQYFETDIKVYLYALIALDMKKSCGRDDHPNGLAQKKSTFAGKKEDQAKILHDKLKIIRDTLSSYTFLTGDKIGWADLAFVGGLYMVEFLDKKTLTAYIFTGEDDILSQYYYRVIAELKSHEKIFVEQA